MVDLLTMSIFETIFISVNGRRRDIRDFSLADRREVSLHSSVFQAWPQLAHGSSDVNDPKM